VLLSSLSLLGAASCLDLTGNDVANSQIRVVNASGQSLNIFVDDHLQIDGSVPPNVSLIVLPSGSRKLTARTAAGIDTDLELNLTPGGNVNTYAYTNSSGAVVLALLDSTTAPAGNSAKIRAINLSKLTGAIDIYASQPAGSAGTKLNTTFDYLTLTPFLEKPSGSWEVYYTAAGGSTKLNSTGTFPVQPGERRTVVVLDSASVPIFRVLPN
jgi:hypothetical protein